MDKKERKKRDLTGQLYLRSGLKTTDAIFNVYGKRISLASLNRRCWVAFWLSVLSLIYTTISLFIQITGK